MRTERSRGARRRSTGALAAGALAVGLSGPIQAGEADVREVRISKVQSGVFRIEVTVAHRDEGWQHYANRWEVVAPDGQVLATRVLRHPHVHEQPFTRALPRVHVPEGNDWVTIRAHDSVHEGGGVEQRVELPR